VEADTAVLGDVVANPDCCGAVSHSEKGCRMTRCGWEGAKRCSDAEENWVLGYIRSDVETLRCEKVRHI
jgi:hypothetical protein